MPPPRQPRPLPTIGPLPASGRGWARHRKPEAPEGVGSRSRPPPPSLRSGPATAGVLRPTVAGPARRPQGHMARCRLGVLAALGALPGALGSEGSGSPNSVTVWLLVLLLLLLLAALALAWYHLNRESGGYYHPTRLGSSLGRRARRLLRATGLTRWLRGSAVEELQDSTEKQEDEEDEDEEEEEEEHLEPDEEHGQQPEQKPKDGGPSGSQGLEAALVEAAPGEAKEDPQAQPSEAQPSEAGGSSGGSSGAQSSEAGALLSDLHAFSGSAAWEDGAGAEGGHGLSVTAL